ncbi:MAG: hypothetical protein PF485_07335 [Bacteroidales bacterium]|jgi:hypothetical protein|nr:hypothetical protein [Bacteroidales bacterium]
MKNYLFKSFFFTILSLIAITTSAQDIKEFQKDSTIFIEQFEGFVNRNLPEHEEDSLKIFLERWNIGYYSNDIKDRFIDVCNLMLKNKARRNPHFTKYFDIVMAFYRSEEALKHYDNWEKGIYYIFENEKFPLRVITGYFNNSKSLIERNILYSSYSTNWETSSKDFEIIVDKELKIVFKKTNLTCRIKKDSINIFETSGEFYPTTNKWHGINGIVNWERADYEANSVNAILKNYKINFTKSGYTADSVTFYNKIYFDEPILGRLSDQVVHVITADRAIYPEFNSYQKRFHIENIYPDINYDGGFSMKGANLLGSGDQNNLAHLYIQKNDTTIITAVSNTYMFKQGRIVSNNAQITIRLKNDSIFHPGVSLNYTSKLKEVSLTPSERIVSKSPYFNSYHQISMSFDQLLWRINEDKIYLTKKRGGAIGNATFTSSNFFNLMEFERIMLRDEFHPLYVLKNFSKKINSETFSGEELARFLKYDDYQIKQMLMYLSVDGFVFYDADKDEAIIKQKLYDFMDARYGKIDYDVIKFNSITEGLNHNGVLDLNNYNLEIKGIPQIFLSDSQNVAIYPQDNQIIMQKNRDFSFAGIVEAGLFTFYGQEFYFHYDTFRISLSNINSLEIKVQTEERDMYNNPLLDLIQNKIEVITGDLYIDKPYNKSGFKRFPEYPIFKSYDNSFVYYDDPQIYDGIYKRDSFYFELDPFVIDSLDNFSSKGLRFDGRFNSSNIFPPFNDAIYQRPDNSLGFKRNTPDEGFPLYEGKGTYYNIIDLSNKGLKGSGTLEYLTAKAQTDDIIFFPDSTNIHANDFTLAQRTSGIEFPELSSSEVYISWYPYKNIMYAEQKGDPFIMFGNNSLLSGSLIIQPIGLTGSGTMNLEKAELKSNFFNFESNSFNSDSTTFSLKSLKKTDFNFITENVNGKVDFSTQIGNFNSNEPFTIAKFPKHLYLSYLDKFDWNIANDEIAIESSPQVDSTASQEIRELAKLKDDNLPGALFMSIHRSQDSLRFASTKSTYKLRDSIISASQVEYIKVADALIFPDKNNVTIGHVAEIQTLKNSEIIANTKNRYHKIYKAKINIKGRYKYLGTGDYDYIDENKEIQNIHFTDIFVDSSYQTVAKSKIIKEDNFTLSPVYNYRGDVILYANRRRLTFNGGVKLEHGCPVKEPNYAYFKSEINPDSIYIPISKTTKSISGRGLHAASFITIDSSHIYSRFLDRRRDPNDIALVDATGFLFYNKNSKKYIIAERSKHLNPDTSGNVVTLQKDLCLQHGEGKVNLGIDLGQIKLSPVGSVNHKLEKNEIKTKLILGLDLFISDAALDTLVYELQSAQSLDPMSLTSRFFEKNMNELVGKNDYEVFKDQLMLYTNEAKLPKSTQHTVLLGSVKFNWYTETGSYLNYGKIGIATINNKPINKYVNGYLQILKRRSGDIMKFYFELPNKDYYYFSYTRGVMQTLSNNKNFVNVIQNIRKRSRKLKTPKGETPYRYIIATEQNKVQFLRNMRLFEEAQEAKAEELKRLEQEKLQIEQIEKELDNDPKEKNIEDNPKENEQQSEEKGINKEIN